jgi:hypothetical protein
MVRGLPRRLDVSLSALIRGINGKIGRRVRIPE